MVIIASEEAVKEHNFSPLARLVDYSVAGVDPMIMGIGPVYAIRKLLAKTGMKMEEIGLFEVYYMCALAEPMCLLCVCLCTMISPH